MGLGLQWGVTMAAGDKMFVLPPKSIQLGDKELEEWLRSVERPQIRRPISFLEERVVMLEGKLGEVVRLTIREVEEERRERIRMGWYLAFSQGTIFALLLILWRRTSQS